MACGTNLIGADLAGNGGGGGGAIEIGAVGTVTIEGSLGIYAAGGSGQQRIDILGGTGPGGGGGSGGAIFIHGNTVVISSYLVAIGGDGGPGNFNNDGGGGGGGRVLILYGPGGFSNSGTTKRQVVSEKTAVRAAASGHLNPDRW